MYFPQLALFADFYDRNRNAITTGSRVMISGTGHTGIIKAIESEGLDAGQIRRGK
ncbi:putative selenium delivery protein YdfZ, partial [Salmonella enterica subsp. enterica serovar Kentucky]|nr:putative selenium delivery protein YdfZ [Salmonella enterica subsp. enterica serovar Kentucky]